MRAAARELDPDRVRRLMTEYRRSPETFFANYGGGLSTGYDLIDDEGHSYPPAAIVQAALGWKDVKGGLRHADSAGAALKANGFRVIQKGVLRPPNTARISKLKSKLREIEKTEKDAQVKIRVGASVLRKYALRHHLSCEVTGIDEASLLRVSHIVPWKDSNESRLDPDNVILLSALWDAAFDRGLVTFCEAGIALFSNQLSVSAREPLKQSERKSLALTERRRCFLGQHRKKYGFPV